MTKRIISLMIVLSMLVLSLNVYATDYLIEPYTNDFSDAESVYSAFKTASAVDSTNLTDITAVTADVMLENGALRVVGKSGANTMLVYPMQETVPDNIKVSFKVSASGLIQSTAQFVTDNGNKTMESLYFRTDSGKLYICYAHAYGVGSGTTLATVNSYNGEFIPVELYYNMTDKTISVSLDIGDGNGMTDYGTFDMSVYNNSWYVQDTDTVLGMRRFAVGAYKGTSNTCVIDDFSIVRDIPLEVSSTSTADGAINFEADYIDVIFNKKMKDTDFIYLEKVSTGTKVAIKNEITEKTVKVKILDNLESLTDYRLVVDSTLAEATDGSTMTQDYIINFKTKIMDNIAIKNPAVIKDNSSLNVKADITNSGAEISASVYVALYEKKNNSRMLKKLEKLDTSIGAEYQLDYTFQGVTFDYEAAIYVTDSNLYPLTTAYTCDADGEVTYVSEVVTEDKIEADYQNGVITIQGNAGTLGYVHKAVGVYGDGTDLIYIAQTLTNENGSYKFSFVPPSDKAYTSYKICVNGSEMTEVKEVTAAIDYSKFFCKADNLKLTGGYTADDGKAVISSGDELIVWYDFESIIGDAEGDTDYSWEASESQTEGFSAISGANAKAYKPGEADEYKYIRAAVTPKSKVGQTVGETKYTEAFMVYAKPVASNVSMTGNAVVGSILKGSYTYSHKKDLDEKGTIYSYQTSSSANGPFTEVGNGLSYVVKSSDAGKYIKLVITPYCDGEPYKGESVETAAVYVSNASSGSGGGGGSSSGGGGKSSIPVSLGVMSNLQPIEEQKEEPKAPFGDIENHWAADYIIKLYDKGIVKGKTVKEFAPDDQITRAEFTTLVMRTLGIADAEYVAMFDDVNKSDWFSGSIQAAVTNGIMRGDGAMFRPNGFLTRQEMAKVIVTAYELKAEAQEAEIAVFLDNDKVADWAKDFVSKAVAYDLMQGTENGSFEPCKETTRAEVCAVISRFIDKTEGDIEE